MLELQKLRADHASGVLRFELANRSYFAAWVSDRGDDFYEQFSDIHATRLAEQQAGEGAYYVLVDDDGSVVGRVNLIIDGHVAELGYRVAQSAAGRGLATKAVRQLCELAADEHGIRRLVAAASRRNVASQKVLTNNGFVLIGPADPDEVGGQPGYRYERLLPGPDSRG